MGKNYKEITIEEIEKAIIDAFKDRPKERKIKLYFADQAGVDAFNQVFKEEWLKSIKRVKHYHRKTKRKSNGK